MTATILNSLQLLVVLVTPFVVFTLIIHQLERFTQHRLAERFGWKSILWTGWLGTPIHELSHVAMCLVFRHRIDDVALFEPDVESGRLGFVRHSFTRDNWFERLGNVFIGLAPLAGGALALAALLMMFYPQAVENSIKAHQLNVSPQAATNQSSELNYGQYPGGQYPVRPYQENQFAPTNTAAITANLADGAQRAPTMSASIQRFYDTTTSVTGSLFRQIFNVENFQTKRFWVFLYLTLCVGSHMAPSRSDYQGALHGAGLFVGILIFIVLAVSVIGIDSVSASIAMMKIFTPLFAVMILAIILCTIAAALVFLITLLFPIRYELR